jgi:hypothetical protein
MENMKPQGGYAPSEEDSAKINEFVTWIVGHGYNGIMLIHKQDVGVSWMNVKNAEEIRHMLINSLSHIADEDESAAVTFVQGMVMAVNQIMK